MNRVMSIQFFNSCIQILLKISLLAYHTLGFRQQGWYNVIPLPHTLFLVILTALSSPVDRSKFKNNPLSVNLAQEPLSAVLLTSLFHTTGS